MRSTILLLSAAVVLLSFGCNRTGHSVSQSDPPQDPPQPAELIAVIDINEVARQIGAMDEIRQSLAEYQSDLTSKLNSFKDELNQQYLDEQERRTDDLNAHESGELDEMLAKHQRAISQQALLAENQLAKHHNQLTNRLIDQIRPVAFEIASEQGMQVVLTTAQIYAAGPQTDITQAVAQRMNQQKAKSDEKKAAAPRVAELPGGGEFRFY